MVSKEKVRSVEEKFWDGVSISQTSDCWEWIGPTNHFYGKIWVAIAQRGVMAHRTSYLLNIGEIPDGMKVCHRCDNPPCVNPEHLFLGTQLDNVRDMISKGRRAKSKIGDWNRAKTHCPRGHEFTPENTRIEGEGGTGRRCKTCERDRNLRRTALRRALALRVTE